VNASLMARRPFPSVINNAHGRECLMSSFGETPRATFKMIVGMRFITFGETEIIGQNSPHCHLPTYH
jgi:hypothetical protein